MTKQCDLARPCCLRCVKYGKNCPGYRDPLDVAFINQNVISIEKSQGRKARDKAKTAIICPLATHELDLKPGPLTTSENGEHTIPQDHGSTAVYESESLSLTPMYHILSESLSTHAAPLILNQYSAFKGGTGNTSRQIFGYHSFLPDLLRRQDASCLKLAVEAWADAYMNNQPRRPLDAYCRPSASYDRALRAVNASLREPAVSSKDTTLAAVWVLGNYEVSIRSLLRLDYALR